MLSGLDFSDLIDPDIFGHVAENVADESSKNLELLAGKADGLKQAGLADKFRGAKDQLRRKFILNLGITSSILGPACGISLFAGPSLLEAAKPALAALAFHLGTEAARTAEEDILETLERRHAKANGHATPARIKPEITAEQARKNLRKILWLAGIEVAATAMIAVEGLSTKEIIGTYAAYLTSMTFLNYGISRGIVSIHEKSDGLAKSNNRFIKMSGELMHKAAQGFYRHNRLLAVIGAGFSVGRAYAHVFERDAKTTEFIAQKAGELGGLAAEGLAKGAMWLTAGATVGGVGLLLDKACGPLIAEEAQSLKEGVRLLAQDWHVLQSQQPFYAIDKAVTGVVSAPRSIQKTFRAVSVSLPFYIQSIRPKHLSSCIEPRSGYYRPHPHFEANAL